ncbi:MAG: lipoyl(octanoyl) transferase LipB [Fermentimonas sp.]|nr:lipoyl(octanoyl) transferase LipB [Fermentimonas sp.]
MSKEVVLEDLGKIRYKKAWDYQEEIFQKLIKAKALKSEKRRIELLQTSSTEENEIRDTVLAKQYLLFCEHDHVYTLGKSGNKQNLLIARNICESRGIDLHEIDRGGDITYHGPGQIVVYPIIDLEEFYIGIKSYISMLEDVVIETLKSFGIKGEKDGKAMGVWLDAENSIKARKICAIGVKASRYITMHGLALNVNTDLSYFDYINPCGFTDRGVTSMEKELNMKVDLKEVSEIMKNSFENVFGIKWIEP